MLLRESVQGLAIHSGDVVVDATFGRGGHTRAFLNEVGHNGKVIGLDVDPQAAAASTNIEAENFIFVRQNFRQIDVALAMAGVTKVHRIFLDLGVSSPQFDQGERGFSYRYDAPLDMRMDLSQKVTAAQLVNSMNEAQLAQILWEYGEERWAKRIAKFIVTTRHDSPINTTFDLVEVIRAAIPKAVRENEDQHPARRTFQALRIAVNDELEALKEGLSKAVALLHPGGRIGCISFHSLEDRVVKQFFAEKSRDCLCPPNIPTCVCGNKAVLKLVTRKPIVPTDSELETNPRARSAHLRIAERLPMF